MANRFTALLQGGDLRSISRSNVVVKEVSNQQAFDDLFANVYHTDRVVVMRSLDAIEKITINHPEFLVAHKQAVLKLLHHAKDIEARWHVALVVSRLPLTQQEAAIAWQELTTWALDKKESTIVRVNAIQSLYELCRKDNAFQQKFDQLILQLQNEKIPAIAARLRKLKTK